MENLSFDYIVVSPHAVEEEIFHKKANEILYIIEGSLEALLDGQTHSLKAGDYVVLPKETRHKFINRSDRDAKLISFCAPGFSDSDVFQVSAVP